MHRQAKRYHYSTAVAAPYLFKVLLYRKADHCTSSDLSHVKRWAAELHRKARKDPPVGANALLAIHGHAGDCTGPGVGYWEQGDRESDATGGRYRPPTSSSPVSVQHKRQVRSGSGRTVWHTAAGGSSREAGATAMGSGGTDEASGMQQHAGPSGCLRGAKRRRRELGRGYRPKKCR
jgi:hypothetical protein